MSNPRLSCALLFAWMVGAPALAAEHRPFTVEELLSTHRPSDVAVSPDGKWVTFTVAQKSLAENRDLQDVWIAALPHGPARPLTRNTKSEHARWSPNGKQLVVVSKHDAGPPQLFLYDLSQGGDPRQLTTIWGGAENATWSPDGKWIAFTSDVYPECSHERTFGAEDACNKQRADQRASTKVQAHIDDHLFARHWTQWREDKRTHLFVIPVAEHAEPRDLTPDDSDWPTWRLGGGDDFAFKADGSAVIVSHKLAAKEAWSTNSDLWEIPTRGGAPKNLTADNPGDDAEPKVSPNGRYVAYRAQSMDGFESDQWKLMLLDLQSGKRSVIGDFDDDAGHAAWRADSKSLVVSVLHHGRVELHTLAISGHHELFSKHPASDDFDVAPDGSVVAVVSGMNRPPEVAHLSPGGAAPTVFTELNREQYAALDLGPAPTDLWVDAADGAKIHAWLLKPPGLTAGKRVPLVVLVHGGPQGSWEDLWGMRWNPTAYSTRGYAVLMPDIRGSTGYGHKFELAISKDWGGKSFDDLMRTVDAAEKQPFIEPGHTCAAGASFGGYMIDWVAGHTDRFRCLVTHDGVFDLVSEYGSTEELWFPEFEMGGPYWEHPDVYRKWSPSTYAQNFKTPTLVVEGELDFRVPTEQALGMFTALQRRGVESRLLWFPDEGHWVNKPRNSQLWYHTVLDWIDAHAKPTKGKQGGRAGTAP